MLNNVLSFIDLLIADESYLLHFRFFYFTRICNNFTRANTFSVNNMFSESPVTLSANKEITNLSVANVVK